MFCLDLLNNKECRTGGRSARGRLRELLEHEELTPPLTAMCELSLLLPSPRSLSPSDLGYDLL